MTNGPTRATVHPHRRISCRNNLQQQVAPRRQGLWVPSLSRDGVFGAPLLGATPTLVREFLFRRKWQLGRFPLRDASQGSEPSPPSDGRFQGRRTLVRSTIVRWQEGTDPQSPEGGSQRACHTEGAHPTASGRLEGVALIEQTVLLSCGSSEAVSLGCQPESSESADFLN